MTPPANPNAVACPHCGRENDGGRYCQDCGKPLPGTVTASGVRCAACGHGPLDGDLPFCPRCGQRADGSGARPSTSAGLILLDDAGEPTQRYPLTQAETTIGRVNADITFPDDPFLSPLHAQINLRDAKAFLRDLGSRNGTWHFQAAPYRLQDGDLVLVGSQVLRFRRLGYPGPAPPEADATRRLGSLIPGADIATVTQLRGDGSPRDVMHLSPGREVRIGREKGDWVFPYDPSMSGRHALLRSEDADFVILDDGSRNGIAVSVRGEVSLQHGSRVLVGDKTLRLELP